MFNYSFWADEAYVAAIASQLSFGKFFNLENLNPLYYQKLYVLTIAFFFKLFGINEFVARLPSLLLFAIGIVTIFLLARKLSNFYGGVLSSFLYTFSHLNLAYATQAKPYSALEAITLLVILLVTNTVGEKRTRRLLFYHITTILLLCIAAFIHTLGVLIWVLYLVSLVSTLKRSNVLVALIGLIAFPLALILIIAALLPYISMQLFPHNNLYQILKLFAYKYTLISICAAIGYLWIFKMNKILSLAILAYSLILLTLSAFQQYTFNIRYVLSLFGIMFLYFGVFWARVGAHYFPKKQWIIPIAVIILLYVTGYKIVRMPQAYYNPNIDKYGDVQIANYKDFYSKLKQQFPNYKELYVINDTVDVESWYFGRYSNVYFLKFTLKPYKHSIVNALVYGSLNDFKRIVRTHPQGLLIMEDWQSLLPDDVKEYAKKNLKLEFRVESLKEAPDDPWPLALYSWGMNDVRNVTKFKR